MTVTAKLAALLATASPASPINTTSPATTTALSAPPSIRDVKLADNISTAYLVQMIPTSSARICMYVHLVEFCLTSALTARINLPAPLASPSITSTKATVSLVLLYLKGVPLAVLIPVRLARRVTV